MTDFIVTILMLYIWAGIVAIRPEDVSACDNTLIMMLQFTAALLFWPLIYVYKRTNIDVTITKE